MVRRQRNEDCKKDLCDSRKGRLLNVFPRRFHGHRKSLLTNRRIGYVYLDQE
jgi:hypothetical protein